MKELGDLILQIGLGAAAIVAITWIALTLIKYITTTLTAKLTLLHDIIVKLIDRINDLERTLNKKRG